MNDFPYLCILSQSTQECMVQLNRLKEVLNEQKKTGKWLAENLSKDTATVSRWCNNRSQPSIETLDRIATLLDIDRRELINKSK